MDEKITIIRVDSPFDEIANGCKGCILEHLDECQLAITALGLITCHADEVKKSILINEKEVNMTAQEKLFEEVTKKHPELSPIEACEKEIKTMEAELDNIADKDSEKYLKLSKNYLNLKFVFRKLDRKQKSTNKAS